MLLTEEEAATKTCHRTPSLTIEGHPLFSCIGSRCMAWRTDGADGQETAHVRTAIRRDNGELEYIKLGKAPSDPGWEPNLSNEAGQPIQWERRHSQRGFCGLAGKP